MTGGSSPEESANREQSFIAHLVELRARLLRALTSVLIIFAALFYFASDLYRLVASPLIKTLAPGGTMIATEVAAPFLAPVKLTLFISVFLAMPYILYQAWAFIAPGLYRHERRIALPLLVSSIVLFYAGIGFAYFVVFPLLFGFLTAVAPAGVAVMTDISRYLDFILTIFLAFGLAFEVPVATFLMVWAGFTTVEALSRNRPYIIIAAFVLGMLLTPPDVISQILLALPIWWLFELGLYLSRRLVRRQGGGGDPR